MGSRRLKPGWTRVAFGEVVRQVRDHVDPATADLRRYVAGEHMDTDDLRIRRWGTVGDGYLGPAFHMRFRPGHVLYGSRRTYLRKVAVADFEGVTANTTFVIETRDPNLLLPELLPFVMQTKSFHEHSIKKSKGSVNPYVNFSDIAAYEFVLPPLDEQRRMATLLASVDACCESLQNAIATSLDVEYALMVSICARLLDVYPLSRLADVADVRYGLSITPGRRLSSAAAKRVPYLRVANVLRNSMDLSDLKMTNERDGDGKYLLCAGDVLIVEGHANPLQIGRACVWRNQIPRMLHQNHVIRARCRDLHHPDYLCAIVNSPHGQRYFRSQTKTSSGLYTINSTVVGNYRFPLPPPSVQHSIVDRLRPLRLATARILAERVKGIETLTKSTLEILLD